LLLLRLTPGNQLLGSHGGFVPSFSAFFDHFLVEDWDTPLDGQQRRKTRKRS
jgi:hypothetical protein